MVSPGAALVQEGMVALVGEVGRVGGRQAQGGGERPVRGGFAEEGREWA